MAKIVRIHKIKFPTCFTHQSQVWDIYKELKKTAPELDIKERLEMIKNNPNILNKSLNKKPKKKDKPILDFSNIKPRDVDYREFLQSKEWKNVREKIISERKCCELTNSKKDLQIHHIKYNILGRENQTEIQKDWLLLVSEKAHFEIHNNPLFALIDPKRNKNPMKREEFLYWFDNFKKLTKTL